MSSRAPRPLASPGLVLVCAAMLTCLARGDGGLAPASSAPARAAAPPAIIDTHTHFWDTSREIPPGRSRAVPFASPDRPILAEHYEAAAGPAGVTGTVVVEASPWLEDNEWLLAQARRSRIVVGVVGNLAEVLGKPAFGAALERLAADPLFRGIRVRPDDLARPELAGHLAMLADRGLMVDVNAGGLGAIRTVAANAGRHPRLRIVLDHAGYVPFGRDPGADWAAALAAVARNPNVYCKISRFQEQAAPAGQRAPTDLDAYRPTLDLLWRTFGEDRLIFGSNWPLSESAGALADAVGLLRQYFAAKGDGATQKFFWKNARAVYGWVPR